MKLSEDERWSVTKALKIAEKMGIPMTRPTLIKMCRENGIGYQPTGEFGNWLIYAKKFIEIIKG